MTEEYEYYVAYMLRLWQSTHNGAIQLLLTLENPHTGRQHTFKNLDELGTFLKGLSEGLAQRQIG